MKESKILRFEPDSGVVVRTSAGDALVALLASLGLVVFDAFAGTGAQVLLFLLIGVGVAALAFLIGVGRTLPRGLSTVVISDSAIRVIDKRSEREMRWAEVGTHEHTHTRWSERWVFTSKEGERVLNFRTDGFTAETGTEIGEAIIIRLSEQRTASTPEKALTSGAV